MRYVFPFFNRYFFFFLFKPTYTMSVEENDNLSSAISVVITKCAANRMI